MDPAKEIPEDALPRRCIPVIDLIRLEFGMRFIVENDSSDLLVLERLAKDRAASHCTFRVLVAFTQLRDHLWLLVGYVGDGGRLNLRVLRLGGKSKGVGEDGLGILAGLEWKKTNGPGEIE